MKQSIMPAPPSRNSSAPGQQEALAPHPRSNPAAWNIGQCSPKLAFLFLAVACTVSTLIPRAHLDWLNAIPAALTTWIGVSAFSWSRSRVFRTVVAVLCLLLAAEFCLRTTSYHRSLQYERQGDLLFTPAPDQEYMEKISFTPSRINSLGLRGEPFDRPTSRHLVLSLGDSITYGYGVDDRHTYPALLEDALSRSQNGQFTILNAGVNAYPMSLIRQKFLYLWARGIHPDIAIIGYSMNEGWLGNLVEAEEKTKRQFERRVWFKNFLRRSALYNVVVENWARAYYDSLKSKLVPGTNSVAELAGDSKSRYERVLDDLLRDLRIRNVTPVFLLFCSYNGAHRTYDSTGPLQQQFAAFAEHHRIPLMRTDEILRAAADRGDLGGFFIDQVHMNGLGTSAVAIRLSQVLPSVLSPDLRPTSQGNPALRGIPESRLHAQVLSINQDPIEHPN
jgi:lysophospholipase L1-like esterase